MKVSLPTGVEIAYETRGNENDPPLILLWGLAGQGTVMYTDDFCDRFVAKGYYVIRLDNRDIGLSSQMTSFGPAKCMLAKMICHVTCSRFGVFPSCIAGRRDSCFLRGGYTIADMAFDVVGFLDALNIEQADFVGQSMGGMIMQEMLLGYPERIRSLTILMSSGHFPLPDKSIAHDMNRGPPPNADAAAILKYRREIQRALAGRAHLRPGRNPDEDDALVNEIWGKAIARQEYMGGREGTHRQLQAIVCSRRRYGPLKRMFAARQQQMNRSTGVDNASTSSGTAAESLPPVCVIHGLDDLLVHPDNSRQLHACMPGSRLVEIEHMGHEVHPAHFDILEREILQTIHSARGQQRPSDNACEPTR